MTHTPPTNSTSPTAPAPASRAAGTSPEAWLALRLAAGMSRDRFRALIHRFGTPDAVFGADAARLSAAFPRGLDAAAVRAIFDAPRVAPVTREMDLMAAKGARLLTPADAGYPENFRRTSAPPPLLFARGEVTPDDRFAVALVGSRQPTAYGRTVAARFASRLAGWGLAVVSGFARGIDATAHRAALDAAGGRTIAVLGNGLAVNYPADHGGLGDRIADGRGAILSEYPMTDRPEAFHFPERNHLIAGLSLATLVVEAAPRSGALITARVALDENRFVFAVPGDITRETSRGTNALIREGARLASRPEDLLDEMADVLRGYLKADALAAAAAAAITDKRGDAPGPSAPEPTKPPPPASAGLGDDEARLVAMIRRGPMHLDALAAAVAEAGEQARFPVPRLAALLTGLELKGAITVMPGRVYAVLD